MRKAMPWPARLVVSVAAAGLFLTVPALAQSPQYPDVTGTWSVESRVVIIGNPPQWPHVADSQKPHLEDMHATLVIKGEQGGRFWGDFITPTHSQKVVGIFTGEDQRFIMDTEHGIAFGAVVPGNRIRWCYTQVKTMAAVAQVASCNDGVRK